MSAPIGIVACSAEGAALCYRQIAAEGARRMGRHAHPEVSMHTHPLAEYMKRIEAGDWAGVAALMVSSARKLRAVGAELLICPDNTIHQAYDAAAREAGLPWLHIAEVVTEEAARRGFRRLGLMGTVYLMNGPVYPPRLAARGIECLLPARGEQEMINRTIFEELVAGRFTDEARGRFGAAIDRLREAGADAVVLGCTEIPILMDGAAASLPMLDSTRLLARAAVARALAP
jgi:aspartate racemase